MQSGRHIRSFISTSKKKPQKFQQTGAKALFGGVLGDEKQKHRELAHAAAITGCCVDLVNRGVVSGASDGTVHFWTFNPPQLRAKMRLNAGVTRFRLDRFSNLLAVALQNDEVLKR
jgi:hypothetical protein